jgi:hypothetical protein
MQPSAYPLGGAPPERVAASPGTALACVEASSGRKRPIPAAPSAPAGGSGGGGGGVRLADISDEGWRTLRKHPYGFTDASVVASAPALGALAAALWRAPLAPPPPAAGAGSAPLSAPAIRVQRIHGVLFLDCAGASERAGGGGSGALPAAFIPVKRTLGRLRFLIALPAAALTRATGDAGAGVDVPLAPPAAADAPLASLPAYGILDAAAPADGGALAAALFLAGVHAGTAAAGGVGGPQAPLADTLGAAGLDLTRAVDKLHAACEWLKRQPLEGGVWRLAARVGVGGQRELALTAEAVEEGAGESGAGGAGGSVALVKREIVQGLLMAAGAPPPPPRAPAAAPAHAPAPAPHGIRPASTAPPPASTAPPPAAVKRPREGDEEGEPRRAGPGGGGNGGRPRREEGGAAAGVGAAPPPAASPPPPPPGPPPPVHLAIIVPFRDQPEQNRGEQLRRFAEHMPAFLRSAAVHPPLASFHIYVAEQSADGHKFNRGKTLNVGFTLAATAALRAAHGLSHLPAPTAFCFHDVDLLPGPPLGPWYAKHPYHPLHLGAAWSRYPYPIYVGGIITMSEAHVRATNGFPNNFWGWGGEDDEMYGRLGQNRLLPVVKTPPELAAVPGVVVDLEEELIRERGGERAGTSSKAGGRTEWRNMKKRENLQLHPTTWHSNGVCNVDFDVLATRGMGPLNAEGRADVTVFTVDLHAARDPMTQVQAPYVPGEVVQGGGGGGGGGGGRPGGR